jgi:hypothetical protein
MTTRLLTIPAAAFCAAGLLFGAQSASAMTSKECGANYQAAKKAGTLNGQSWKDYRAAHCTSASADTAPSATAATTATTPVATPAAEAAAMPAKTPPASSGSAVFPSKIDPKYASLKAGTGRMKTCDDQYKLNKATGGNGGMKWIQKGGGYYSACSKHLKGV